MRTLIHDTFGDPAEVITVREVEDPRPAAGELLLRTVLAPIHHHDLWTIRGSYGVKPELPARPGSEAVAIIEELGEGVEGLEVGQRVAVASAPGAWSERFTAPAAAAIPLPDALPDEAAAQLVAMPFSAVSLLDFLDLEAGDVLVQNAATGAVGRLLAQFAVARGVRVIGLARRESGVEELAAQGITDVVATDTEGWEDRARELIGEGTVRVGLDSVGGEAATQVLNLLSDGGRLVVFGAMAASTMALPSGPIIFRDLTVEGFWGARVSAEMEPAHRAELMREIITRLLSGEATLPVAATYPLEEAAEAVRATLGDARGGKVLLRP